VDHFHASVVLLLSLFFSDLDSVMTSALHVIDPTENLAARIFCVLLVHVTRFVMFQEVFRVELLLFGCDLALPVMVKDEYASFFEIELSLHYLTLGVLIGIEREFLGHLLNVDHGFEMVIVQNKALPGASRTHVWVKCNTSVDHAVFPVLVAFNCLAADIFLPVNKMVLVSMVVEVEFSVLAVDLDQLFPMTVSSR